MTHSHASSPGYETACDENGNKLVMVGDEYVTEAEANADADAEREALAAMGDPEAIEELAAGITGYPRH